MYHAIVLQKYGKDYIQIWLQKFTTTKFTIVNCNKYNNNLIITILIIIIFNNYYIINNDKIITIVIIIRYNNQYENNNSIRIIIDSLNVNVF